LPVHQVTLFDDEGGAKRMVDKQSGVMLTLISTAITGRGFVGGVAWQCAAFTASGLQSHDRGLSSTLVLAQSSIRF
jgi:hypothetical protein